MTRRYDDDERGAVRGCNSFAVSDYQRAVNRSTGPTRKGSGYLDIKFSFKTLRLLSVSNLTATISSRIPLSNIKTNSVYDNVWKEKHERANSGKKNDSFFFSSSSFSAFQPFQTYLQRSLYRDKRVQMKHDLFAWQKTRGDYVVIWPTSTASSKKLFRFRADSH